MTTYTNAVTARSSSVLNLGTLAATTYICSSAIDLTAMPPEDITIEVECVHAGTADGNKQLKLFAKLSLDGTNYGSGPESGTSAIDEADLHLIGVLPTVNSPAVIHRKFFSVAAAMLPVARYMKIVVRNDTATIALTSGNVYTSYVTGAS